MSNPNGPLEPERKSNVALIVSLCLNLLLIGVIAMGTFRMFHPGMGFGMGQGFGRGQGPHAPMVLMRLVPAESDKIKAILAYHRDRQMSLGRDAMDARHQVMRAFMDPEFDQQTFDRALEHMRAADAAFEAEQTKVVSESVATLTPEERQAAADSIRSHMPFGRHHRGQGRGRGF